MSDQAVEREAFAKRFGQNLRRVRRAAGFSQDVLAHRAAMHRTEVSQIERGVRLPRADTLWRIAQSLEADFGDLFAGLIWRQPRPEARDPGGGET